MHPSLRRLWLKLHRWTGLTLGLVLALAALLGSLLTIAKPLDRWMHPELFLQDGAGPAPAAARLEQVRRELAAELGADASFTFRPPRAATDTLWVYVRGSWDGIVFLDAATGRERGRRGEHEGFYNLLFEMHGTLLLGDTGKAVLAAAALAYLLLLVAGLVLWWPRRWPPAFTIAWRRGFLRCAFDLHTVGGALLGPLIVVAVASGAYMAWPPLRVVVSTLAGESPVALPAVHQAASGRVALDELVARATRQYPDARVGYVQVPASARQPVRVRLKLPQDPHPNGLTSVWLHPATGEVLAQRRFDRLDLGHRAVSIVYPLHTGELGGTALIVAVGLAGAALAGLGGTGVFLWARRRRSASVRARATTARFPS